MGSGASKSDDGAAAAAAAAAQAEMEKIQPVIVFMRMLNLGAAAALIAVSILKMVTLPGPARWLLSIYATCGGCLICCLETQLKFLRVMIAMNFGFLFSPIFRFMYYLLMASVALALDSLPSKIVAGIFVGVAVYNTYVLLRYPSYRKFRDMLAEEEDKRINSALSKQVRKQAVKNMTG